MTRSFVGSLGLVASLALAAACSEETPAAAGTGGASSATGVGGSFGAGVGSGGFEGCAQATIEGERVPVHMYIMFDKSGSMLDDQKWAGATAALTAFFQDDESAGLSIALRFFPDDEPVAGCNESACNLEACATPLVPLGELNALPAHSDPQQKALVEAVQSRQPSGQTPMYAALGGAESWALAQASAEAKTVVVLVTDGEPNGCETDINQIAGLAAEAQAEGVLTYAIGMDGASLAQLDQIAAAGGTSKAYVVGQGTVHKDLVAAFEDIGIAPLQCVMPLPSPEMAGAEVEPGEVNVSYTDTSGESSTIPQVSDEGGCAEGDGWYYDVPAMPTTISLCPATCAAVQGDKGAKLDIVLGCKTVVK